MKRADYVKRHSREMHGGLHRRRRETVSAAHRRDHRERDLGHSARYHGVKVKLGRLGDQLRRGSAA